MKKIYMFTEIHAKYGADLCRKLTRRLRKNERVVTIQQYTFFIGDNYYKAYIEGEGWKKL